MSRWLKSVNNILDTLDTNVGDVVDYGSGEFYDGVVEGVEGESSVDDILAKRGLLENDDEEEDDDNGIENDDDDDEKEESGEVEKVDVADEEEKVENGKNDDVEESAEEHVGDGDGDDGDKQEEKDVDAVMLKNDGADDSVTESKSDDQISNEAEVCEGGDGTAVDHDNYSNSGNDGTVDTPNVADGTTSSTGDVETNTEEEEIKIKIGQNESSKSANHVVKVLPADVTARLAELENSLTEQKKLTKKSEEEAKTSKKEAKKLRRNVVKLNAELDAAERELDAQRTELERAAVRIEKDRLRYKEEKERMESEHKEEIKTKTNEHKATTDAITSAHSEQLLDMEERIKRAEEARVKEGGDMTNELAESAARERESLKKALALEEERSTLNSQVSSLQTQLNGMQSRVQSIQETAESASERERESDDRLDTALSLHARQISQRQAREGELERTIADLGAALVLARQRESQLTAENKNTGPKNDVLALEEKLSSLEDECEMLKAQVMLEKQRSETLQEELEELSQERMLESSAALSREKEYDSRLAELTARVTQLQATQQTKGSTISSAGESTGSETKGELQKQISSLSEELMRQRSKLEVSSSEVLTLRNRLRTALTRAEKAEKDQVVSMNANSTYDIESGAQMRRRGGGFRGRHKTQKKSIRSIINLEPGTGETREKLGNIVDTVDNFATDTGYLFLNNPLPRAMFLLYLVLLHLWAFCLVLFHAHWSLEPPQDVGPAELLKQHSYRHMEQAHILEEQHPSP